ncbi:MAG: hypothetical protein A2W99_13770 [Bacteroidetes bacterium GWF2_33_16]|nr:MAG: hypothetical protein A2X00_09070 [Bacteroidetes bacterium GWE2_32_14]OFY04571.1 MAG: hypothetical protein A2W99_13770 [Bacteroidetes bacterium GWF2_33_16]
MTKEKRLKAIRQIITTKKVGSQEELINNLTDLGFELTQATLSRDLKQLKVGRIPYQHGFKYVISDEFVSIQNPKNYSPLAFGFLAIEFSHNIAIIKTMPAYSHTIADAIDRAEMNEIIGTVAGNDTIIAVIREGVSHDQVLKAMSKYLPELKDRLLR